MKKPVAHHPPCYRSEFSQHCFPDDCSSYVHCGLGWIEALKDQLDLDQPLVFRTEAVQKFRIPRDELHDLPFKAYKGQAFFNISHITALARDDKADTRREVYLDLLELELELTKIKIPRIAGRVRREDIMALAAELIVAVVGGTSHLI